jgi:hypothetical protein
MRQVKVFQWGKPETTEQILQRELSEANREIGKLEVRLKVALEENEKLKGEMVKKCG